MKSMPATVYDLCGYSIAAPLQLEVRSFISFVSGIAVRSTTAIEGNEAGA